MEELEPRIVLAADGNDTMSTALGQGSFGATATSFTKNGQVGSTSDSIDYYKFTLTGSNNFVATLTGLSQDLDLQLQTSSGSSIQTSRGTGAASELVGGLLGGGTYYLKVYKGTSSAISNYSLNFRFGDDSTSTAFDMGSFGTTGVSTPNYVSSLGGSDSSDYYKFKMTGSNFASISLIGMSADLDVELLNSSNSVVASGRNTSNTAEFPTAMLASGTYYVRVYKGVSSASSNYTLAIKFGDDSIASPVKFGSLGSGSSDYFNSSLGGSDTVDFYSFELSAKKNGLVTLTGLSADLDFVILDVTGRQIGSVANNSGTNSEQLTLTNFNAGKYYIKVFKGVSSASSNYKLTVKIN